MLKDMVHLLPVGDWLTTNEVNKQDVLQCLATAVWAPNDGLREPWRFLYVDASAAVHALPEHQPASVHLVVIAQQRNTPHVQEEDLCAVYGLVQNLRLLLRERDLGMRIHIVDWMYTQAARRRLGIASDERIAALLDIGYVSTFTKSSATGLNIASL